MTKILNFGVTGVGGYIAPKHLQAIKNLGGQLIAATDPGTSVGILDSFSPDVLFFRETELFEDYLARLRYNRDPKALNYLAVCSPNYLHAAHIRMGLQNGCDVICEKPLVLDIEELKYLKDLEAQHGTKLYNVLQLRVHDVIRELKKKTQEYTASNKAEVVLTYVTRRGRWYHESWKGQERLSGGVMMNIGIHFFDMLMWLFGDCQYSELHVRNEEKGSGYLELERARVRWLLSVDQHDLPTKTVAAGQPAFRSITIDGQEIEFSGGFTELHNRIYDMMLKGEGYGIDDAIGALKLVGELRQAASVEGGTKRHPGVR